MRLPPTVLQCCVSWFHAVVLYGAYRNVIASDKGDVKGEGVLIYGHVITEWGAEMLVDTSSSTWRCYTHVCTELCAHDVIWHAAEHTRSLAEFLSLNYSFLGQNYLFMFPNKCLNFGIFLCCSQFSISMYTTVISPPYLMCPTVSFKSFVLWRHR